MVGGVCHIPPFGCHIDCFFFDVDDTKPLDMADSIIGYIAEIIK